MLSNSVPRTAKINRDMSNFIITQVLERSDDLIKNSYRRLTTENVARNEHWAKIAENVSEKFDIPAEMERVKSHFHNRKKVLLARIKDELKNVPTAALMSTDEKLEELVKRRICVGEYDEQLARVCLDIEEEEKIRTEQFGADPIVTPLGNLFTETSHQSLLSQLLSSTAPMLDRMSPSASSKDSDLLGIPTPNRAPLLSKLLSDPSTSRENVVKRMERKRRAITPLEHTSPVLPSPNGNYLSHLIVDVTSPQELKRLLSVLIDHGFSRFQHVGGSETTSSASLPEAVRRVSRTRVTETPIVEDLFEAYHDDKTPFWTTSSKEEQPENEIDVVKDIKSRVEQVEVKVETILEEEDGEEEEEEVDEQTAELEAQLALEAHGMLFSNGVSLSPKKSHVGDIVTANCELCGSVIRLNAGGSKWNFFEHVMMKHSVHKAYKCPVCPYQTGRKVRVRKHAVSQHGQHGVEPIDLTTPEIRQEWLETMSKCFPHHQYDKNRV